MHGTPPHIAVDRRKHPALSVITRASSERSCAAEETEPLLTDCSDLSSASDALLTDHSRLFSPSNSISTDRSSLTSPSASMSIDSAGLSSPSHELWAKDVDQTEQADAPLTEDSVLTNESDALLIDYFSGTNEPHTLLADNLLANEKDPTGRISQAKSWLTAMQKCHVRFREFVTPKMILSEQTDDDTIDTLMNQAKQLLQEFANDEICWEKFQANFGLIKSRLSRQVEKAAAGLPCDGLHQEQVLWIKDSLMQMKNLCDLPSSSMLSYTASDKYDRALQSLRALRALIIATGDSDLDLLCHQIILDIVKFRQSEDRDWEAAICERIDHLTTSLEALGEGCTAMMRFRLDDLHLRSVLRDTPLMTCGRAKTLLNFLISPEPCGTVKPIGEDIIADLQQQPDEAPLDPSQWQKILTGIERMLLGISSSKSDPDNRKLCIANLEYFYSWCQSQRPVDQSDTSRINMKSQQDFLKVFTVICHSLRGLSERVDKNLATLMDELHTVQSADTLVQQSARISLACEALTKVAVKDITRLQSEVIHPVTLRELSLPFLKTSLRHLQLIANLNWTEAAATIVARKLSDYYFDYYDPAHAEYTTTSVTVSQNILPGVLAEATGAKKTGSVTDRESYIGKVTFTSVSATGGCKLGVDGLKLATLAGTGTISHGGYIEYTKASADVLDNFADYVNKHQYDHDLVPFTCRHSSLRQKKVSGDKVTLQNWRELRERCKFGQQEISQFFEILLTASSRPHRPAELAQEQPTMMDLPPIKADYSPPLRVSITTKSAKGEGRIGPDTPFVKSEARLSWETSKSTLPIVRQKSLVEKMIELEEMAASDALGLEREKITAKQTQITEEIQKTSEALLKKLPKDALQYRAHETHGAHEIYIADSLSDLLSQLLNFFLSLAPWTTAAANNDFPEPEQDPQNIYLAVGRKYQHDPKKPAASHSILTASDPALFDQDDLVLLYSNLTTLKRDFAYHARLKATRGVPTTKLSLQQFYKMYLTDNVEDYLYRAQLLNAYVYTLLVKKAQQPGLSESAVALITRYKQELRAFEQQLTDPPFAIDLDKLKKLAFIKDDCELSNVEDKLNMSADLIVRLPGLPTFYPLQISGTRTCKTRRHVQPLTDGEFIELELRISATPLEVGPLVNTIMGVLAQDVALEGLPGLPENIAAQLAMGGLLNGTRTIVLQWEKTTFIPNIASTFLTQRNINSTSRDHAINGVLPFVSVSTHRSQQKAWLASEIYSPETMQLFFLRYFHEYAIGNINRQGELTQQDKVYWSIVEKEQEESLKKLLINIANRENGSMAALKTELEGLHKVFEKDIATNMEFRKTIRSDGDRTAELEKLNTLQQHLFAAAETYRDHPDGADANYQAALTAFKALMLGYAPHLQHMKVNSYLFKPRDLKLSLALPPTLPPIWSRIKKPIVVPRTGFDNIGAPRYLSARAAPGAGFSPVI